MWVAMRQRTLLALVVVAGCSQRHEPDVRGIEVAPLLAGLHSAGDAAYDPRALDGQPALINFWAPG